MATANTLTEQVRHAVDEIYCSTEPIDERAAALRRLRGLSSDIAQHVDKILLEEHRNARAGLDAARDTLDQFKDLMEKLQQPPLVPAVFLRAVMLRDVKQAWVAVGGGQRIVSVLDTIDIDDLGTGDEVLLSADGALIVAASPNGVPAGGELATFEEAMPDGRIVVRERDTSYIAARAAALAVADLKAGACLRWDRSTQLAYEVVQREESKRFLMDAVPDLPLSGIGGQQAAVQTMVAALTTALVTPDVARKYGVDSKGTILMYGPPGCGKTLLARVAAAELQRLSGTTVRFGVVKPGEFESPWVGETQQNMRTCFATLRESARDGFAVLFMDEIEAIGRTRGNTVGYHSDKFLAALLAELDGFADRGNVAIVAATNRKELIDPALLSRISDVEIPIRRPSRDGAAEIFGIHLPAHLPYSPNGKVSKQTRADVIDAAVTRIYDDTSRNAICELVFMNGQQHTVTAADLISGRTIEQVCREARRAACEREIRTGDAGIRVTDIEWATDNLMDRMDTLTVQNVGAYLTDLPDGLPLAGVASLRKGVAR